MKNMVPYEFDSLKPFENSTLKEKKSQSQISLPKALKTQTEY